MDWYVIFTITELHHTSDQIRNTAKKSNFFFRENYPVLVRNLS